MHWNHEQRIGIGHNTLPTLYREISRYGATEIVQNNTENAKSSIQYEILMNCCVYSYYSFDISSDSGLNSDEVCS